MGVQPGGWSGSLTGPGRLRARSFTSCSGGEVLRRTGLGRVVFQRPGNPRRKPAQRNYGCSVPGLVRTAIANATTHPTSVHPSSKLITNTDPTFGTCRRHPTKHGTKYASVATRNTIQNVQNAIARLINDPATPTTRSGRVN